MTIESKGRGRPKIQSSSQKELDKADQEFKEFNERAKELTPDPFNREEIKSFEPQTLFSKKEVEKAYVPELKPTRTMGRTGNFNPDHKKVYDESWQRINCIVENHEIIGDTVKTWTARWGCDPAYYWEVPTNKMVSIPRFLAEQLGRCKYHRMVMEDSANSADGRGTYYGKMSISQTIHRISCRKTVDEMDGF